jgi:hypothetical protein
MIATVLVVGDRVLIVMTTLSVAEVMTIIMMIILHLEVGLEEGIEAVAEETAGVGGMTMIGTGAGTGIIQQMADEVDREVLEVHAVLEVLVDMEVGETLNRIVRLGDRQWCL